MTMTKQTGMLATDLGAVRYLEVVKYFYFLFFFMFITTDRYELAIFVSKGSPRIAHKILINWIREVSGCPKKLETV